MIKLLGGIHIENTGHTNTGHTRSLDREQLSLTYASLGLVYPPLPRFTGTKGPELYMKVSRRHSFEVFERHGDERLTFTSEGIREVEIERDRILIRENVSTSFDLVRRNFADMVAIVKEELDIFLFFTPRIILSAIWELSDSRSDASELLRGTFGKIATDQLGLLGLKDLHGIGLQIDADIQEGNHISLEINPSYAATNAITIDLTNIRHDQIETPEIVSQRLEDANDYLRSKVADFVESLVG